MPDINMIWWGIILFVGLLLFVFFGQTLFKVGKWIWYGALNMAVGGILIYILNLVGQYINLHIPLNPITAIVIGVLGIPGFMTILIAKFFIMP